MESIRHKELMLTLLSSQNATTALEGWLTLLTKRVRVVSPDVELLSIPNNYVISITIFKWKL